jgi:hypothetical protein
MKISLHFQNIRKINKVKELFFQKLKLCNAKIKNSIQIEKNNFKRK